MTLVYDVVIVGAGASGCSCAWNCAKLGLKTLLVEKNIHAGGLITSGLVVPAMKLNHKNINVDFFNNLIESSKQKNASITYNDGNSAWFNPHLLKSVLDTMLISAGVDVLYNTIFDDVEYKNEKFVIKLQNDTLSLPVETKYLVDATGIGKIFQKLNLEFLTDTLENQSKSLRFILSNVNCEKFVDWISNFDSDRNVTTFCKIGEDAHFSTAYTWDCPEKWALAPYFKQAISDGVLKDTDSAYFQMFTIANMPTSVAFNCPKLILSDLSDNNSLFTESKLIIEGRERINRLTNFCKKYLKGFENAYVSDISDMLGVRESRRIKGKKIFSVSDIENAIIPENIALASDYPIDIHSDKKNCGELKYSTHTWYLPLEALISERYDNLFAIGRCLSAEFKAQAAVRTQINCFSMGEAVAKHIKSII